MHSCSNIAGSEEAGHKMASLPNVGDSGHPMDFSVLSAKDKFVTPGARGAGIQCINNVYVHVQNNVTLLKLSDYKRGFGRRHEQNFLNSLITLKIHVL